MQRPRFHPGAVVLDGKLYVAGGYDANSHRDRQSDEIGAINWPFIRN